MSTYVNLLQTCNGTRLPAELCLRVVELAIKNDPKSIRNYLGLSNDFNAILKSFEVSIIKTVVGPKQNLHYEVLPSCIRPEFVRNIAPCSFRWFSELYFRAIATEYLMNHESLGMFASQWNSRLQLAGVQLLYEFADCTAGLKTGRQIDFLHEMNPLELATLGAIAKGLTLAYEQLLLRNKVQNEGDKRERLCVFENKLLRYGPFFALASFGSEGDLELAWTNEIIQDGLLELEEFETGRRSEILPSLQSQIWVIFSQKMGCTVGDSWMVATGLMDP